MVYSVPGSLCHAHRGTGAYRQHCTSVGTTFWWLLGLWGNTDAHLPCGSLANKSVQASSGLFTQRFRYCGSWEQSRETAESLSMKPRQVWHGCTGAPTSEPRRARLVLLSRARALLQLRWQRSSLNGRHFRHCEYILPYSVKLCSLQT